MADSDASDTGKPAPTPETDAVLAEIIDTVRVDHEEEKNV